MWRKMMRMWLVGGAVTLATLEGLPPVPVVRVLPPRVHPPRARDEGEPVTRVVAEGSDEDVALCGLDGIDRRLKKVR